MQTQSLTHESASLGKEMHMMIYGYGGVPFLAFPTQDGMCRQMEDFGVTDQISEYINNGRIQLFVVDTVDLETWSNKFGDKGWRAWRQEQYFHYIVDEVVPLMREYNDQLPVVMGMSMGANHTAITFLRRPDLFRGGAGYYADRRAALWGSQKRISCAGCSAAKCCGWTSTSPP